MRNSDEVNACVASVVEALGTVDILVNNAVDARVGIPLQDLDDEQFLISFTSGPFASFWFMRACFPHLRDGGRVINLRSGTENQSMVGYGAYVAAKAAVGGLTRAAAREWGREGITVNALVPFALSPERRGRPRQAARPARSALPAVVDSAYGRRRGRRRTRRSLPGRAGRHVHHRLHALGRRRRIVLRIVGTRSILEPKGRQRWQSSTSAKPKRWSRIGDTSRSANDASRATHRGRPSAQWFTEDAVFIDPAWGRVQGRDEITALPRPLDGRLRGMELPGRVDDGRRRPPRHLLVESPAREPRRRFAVSGSGVLAAPLCR